MITKFKLLGLAAAALAAAAFSSQGSPDKVMLDPDLNGVALHKRVTTEDPPCLQMYYYIEQYADTFNIPKDYAYGIAYQETRYRGPFDWHYDHAKTSCVGAVGPMQVMPSTAKLVNKASVSVNTLKCDIQYNVKTSMKLLRILYDKYGDWKTVFGCYNTGRPCINQYAINVYNFKTTW